MNKRLELELKINDLLNLLNHLDKGNQLAVMNNGNLISVIEYDELGKELLKSILKQYIRAINGEIMKLGAIDENL